MTELKTSIANVTVYPDRARLVRRGRIALENGVQRIEIPDLPLSLNPDSARAAGRGTARARLLGLQLERTYYSQTPAESVRELENQVEAAQDELAGLEAQLSLANEQRIHLEALAGQSKVYAKALASGKMGMEAQLALFDGIGYRAAQLDTQRLELQGSKRALERRLEQLKRQLDAQRSARPRERYTAYVEVEVTQPGELEIELSYVLSQSGWKPLYDLRLTEVDGKPSLEVGYLAQVTQNSGEAWTDVALTLSTARPALAATLPELKPWYIAPRPAPPPAPSQAKMAAMRMADGMTLAAPAAEAMPQALAAPPEMEAEERTAQVSESGAAVTYTLPGTVTVPGDGAPHKVTVTRFNLRPELDYVSAPKLVEAAYRRAKVANDSPYTLLPGPANLFDGEEFIGATTLKLTAPQAEIELYLGADDRINVERELKRREVDKAILGGKRRLHYGYEIRLENLLPREAKIIVHDHLPVPRQEDIKVRLDQAEPRPAQHSELNLLDWEMALPAKAKQTIRYDFTVEYPQAMDVIGLP